MLSSTQKRRAVAALLASVVVSLLLAGCDSSTAHTLAPTATPRPLSHITEYPLPQGSSAGDITSGPDSALWFTEEGSNRSKVGRITTAGQLSEYAVPQDSVGLVSITSGLDGALWFTLFVLGPSYPDYPPVAIGRITPASGQLAEYHLPQEEASGPYGAPVITNGPDGALWFTMNDLDPTAGWIGRITPASGQITQFPLSQGSGAGSITNSPDGALWFTGWEGNPFNPSDIVGKIGRITTAGQITEYPLPTPQFKATSITSGPDGALWFAEESSRSDPSRVVGKIGCITTAGQITEYPLPAARFTASGITNGPDGALWFTEADLTESFVCCSGKIGRITTGGSITEMNVPTANSLPGGITSGPDGALWFTEIISGDPTGGKIGRIGP